MIRGACPSGRGSSGAFGWWFLRKLNILKLFMVVSKLYRNHLNRGEFLEGESGSDAGYGRMMYWPHGGAVGRGVKGATLPGMHREKGIGIGTIVADIAGGKP